MNDDDIFGARRRLVQQPANPQFVPFAEPAPQPWPAPQPVWSTPTAPPAWTTPWGAPAPTWTTAPAWAGDPTWWEQSFGRSPRPAQPGAWGKWLDLSPNVQVRARQGTSLAVKQHQPGLWSLGEVPTDGLRSVAGEIGMDDGVFQLLVRAVAKAVGPAVEEISKSVHKGKDKANDKPDVGCDGPCRCGR